MKSIKQDSDFGKKKKSPISSMSCPSNMLHYNVSKKLGEEGYFEVSSFITDDGPSSEILPLKSDTFKMKSCQKGSF